MTALIQVENLHYRPDSYPPEKPDILNGISLAINEGDFIAIIGENGSGKTTLIQHFNGLLLPTSGRILVDGMDTREQNNRKRLRLLVGMVFQNPADQIVASTVEEDVAFGLENLNVPTQEIRKLVAEQLSSADLSDDASRPPHLLSGGQIQKLALAGVLARNPRVILFDEPTSMLDSLSRELFMARICELNQHGMTIIYVTHHMEEAVHADQVVVLHNGTIALSGSPREIFQHKHNLYEMGVEVPEAVKLGSRLQNLGWDIKDDLLTPEELLEAVPVYERAHLNETQSNQQTEKPVKENIVTMENVHYTYLSGTPLAKSALHDLNLEVSTQRLHGIVGSNGSGKSTLLQHINGILRPDQGIVHVGPFELEDPATSLRDVIRLAGLVFQNPETQFFEVFVGEEIAYGPKQFEMDDVRNRVRQAMAMVGLDFEDYKDRRLETLSGGEKRKVALASTLILDQDILLFDEPTAGMDPRSREELLALFLKLQKDGKTIIIASHRIEELARVSQDISVMGNGKMIQTGVSQAVLSDLTTISQANLLPPLLAKITHKLVEKGWPIDDKDTFTPDGLIRTLQELSQ